MTAELLELNDFRKPASKDAPISDKESTQFAMDIVADKWANELVHNLMMQFAERGNDIDFDNPIYSKLMLALTEVTTSMTRHHLDVFDEMAMTLEKYPEGEITIGVMTSFEDGEEPEFVDQEGDVSDD